MEENEGAGTSGADKLADRLAAGLPGGSARAGGAAGDAGGRRSAAEIMPRMGGIALKNGLVLVSDDYWAAAIRETDGAITVASGRKPRLPSGPGRRGGAPRAGSAGQGRVGAAGDETGRRPARAAGRGAASQPQVSDFQGLPLLRGLARFAETLLVVAQVKVRLPQAELPLEGGRVVAALAAGYVATSTVRAVGPKSTIVQETGAALAAFVPAMLSLRNSAITGYHGAEHKVIGGREAELRAAAVGTRYGANGDPAAGFSGGAGGAPVGRSAAAAAPKEHDRCGTNLVGPLLFTTIAANALVRGAVGRMTPAGSAVAGALSLGAALEALRWATRHGDSLAAQVLMSPGRIIQKTLTTTEPTQDQLEVAERAMRELLRVEAAGK